MAGWALYTGPSPHPGDSKASLGKTGKPGILPWTTPRGQDAVEMGQVGTETVGSLPAQALLLGLSSEMLAAGRDQQESWMQFL